MKKNNFTLQQAIKLIQTMIKEEKIFNDWLCRELAKLHLEDEVYTNYVGTIMNDNSYEMEEKRDNAIEFLAAATVS